MRTLENMDELDYLDALDDIRQARRTIMAPTKKSKQIEDLLTNLAGISRQDAAKKNICTLCKKPILGFKDSLSEKEYRISGMCQTCQDIAFNPDLEDYEEYYDDDYEEPAF